MFSFSELKMKDSDREEHEKKMCARGIGMQSSEFEAVRVLQFKDPKIITI